MSEGVVAVPGPEGTAAHDPQPVAVARWRRVLAETLLGGPFALAIPLVAAVLLILFPVISGNQYWIRELSLIAILALVVSGVNLSFGYAGEIQFGQVFMFALGAYLTMVLAIQAWDEVIPLLLIGGLAAALVGAIIAFPAVRIGGWSLALTSFFLVITIPDLVELFSKYTGGLNGLVGIPYPNLFGKAQGNNGLYEIIMIATIVWFMLYRNLVTSRYGVIFRILRQSPVLANSLGFSTFRLKTSAYTLGAFPAGMAGCVFGYISLIVTTDSFGLNLAIGIVAASILGGIESVYGAFIGAAVLQLGPQSSLSFAQYAPILYGVFLLIAAIVFRSGLSGVGKLGALRLSRLLVGPQGSAHTIASGSLSAQILEPTAERAAAGSGASRQLGPFAGAVLTVSDVSKSFGGVHALSDVSLTAEPGEITALIGSNGSGKTTLLNVICGYARADAGRVVFGDNVLTGAAPHEIARLGVARTFQTPSVPRGVSALDVVASGRFSVERTGIVSSVLRLPRYRRARRADRREALRMLELVGLSHIADEEATSLSLGTRRVVEVARALCANPRLLLLDEPASGLSVEEIKLLGAVVKAAAAAGAAVVLIEHNFGFVTSIAGTTHVLHFGALIASGPAATIGEDPAVIESYLGQSSAPAQPGTAPVAGVLTDGTRGGAAPRERRAAGGTLLEVRNVTAGYGDLRVLRGVSLELKEGAIEAVLGRNGVGKTTLLGSITGQVRVWQGSITLAGKELGRRQTYRRAAAGIALVQEGKRIFRGRTIMENLILGTLTQRLPRKERYRLCAEILQQFPMLEERANEPAGGLSGGQQQMLAIAQALASRPTVLLLDEPSSGLAPSIVAEVFATVRALSDAGMTVLLVEQLAQQALSIADHVTVLDNGEVVASGLPKDFHDMRQLQEAYFGEAGDNAS